MIVLLIVPPVCSYVSSSDVSDWTMEAAINITSLRSKSTRRCVGIYTLTDLMSHSNYDYVCVTFMRYIHMHVCTYVYGFINYCGLTEITVDLLDYF